MSGLPYLKKLSLDDFEISVILSFWVLKYGNISQKSWKLNTRTFSFQASCVHGIPPMEAALRFQDILGFRQIISAMRSGTVFDLTAYLKYKMGALICGG